MNARGGRALDGLGVLPDYQTQPNSEYRGALSGSQAAGDKFRCREGKSPDRQLRPQIPRSVLKDVGAH